MKTLYWIQLSLLCVLISSCSKMEQESKKVDTEPDKAEIMILGMYHFKSSGTDSYNYQLDDHRSNKRQSEIQEVTDLLRNFQPNKVMVEFLPMHQDYLDSLYELYKADKIRLDQIKDQVNEVYQIGFRLGKESTINEINAIDHSGNWLGPYTDFIADTLELKFYEDFRKKEEEKFNKHQLRLQSNTVRENLLYINQPEYLRLQQQYYLNAAILVKDCTDHFYSYKEKEENIDGTSYYLRSFDFNNIGVELVSEWYKRNLFIYRNILEQTGEQDKVVVIIGSGHASYLKQMIQNNNDLKLIEVNEYLSQTM